MINEDIICKLSNYIAQSNDSDFRKTLNYCIDALSNWQPIVCGECSETFYAPDCDCTKRDHPLLKSFLRRY